MKKWNLYTCTFEVKHRDARKLESGCIFNICSDTCEELLKQFNSYEGAMEELKNHKAEVENYSSNGVFRVTEYWIEEYEYDDADDFGCGCGNMEFAEMIFEVWDSENGTLLGTFDNYADAEDAYEDYVDNPGFEGELELRFA